MRVFIIAFFYETILFSWLIVIGEKNLPSPNVTSFCKFEMFLRPETKGMSSSVNNIL